eukprot:snap_masked-scaffold_27-processed-gene-1.43-mRNA-1 protein AED:1.00 eAED:1.00 QI:0/-1/0/0/-1/1/1/0/503
MNEITDDKREDTPENNSTPSRKRNMSLSILSPVLSKVKRKRIDHMPPSSTQQKSAFYRAITSLPAKRIRKQKSDVQEYFDQAQKQLFKKKEKSLKPSLVAPILFNHRFTEKQNNKYYEAQREVIVSYLLESFYFDSDKHLSAKNRDDLSVLSKEPRIFSSEKVYSSYQKNSFPHIFNWLTTSKLYDPEPDVVKGENLYRKLNISKLYKKINKPSVKIIQHVHSKISFFAFLTCPPFQRYIGTFDTINAAHNFLFKIEDLTKMKLITLLEQKSNINKWMLTPSVNIKKHTSIQNKIKKKSKQKRLFQIAKFYEKVNEIRNKRASFIASQYLEVLKIGKINPIFHSKSYIFPAGYKVKSKFFYTSFSFNLVCSIAVKKTNKLSCLIETVGLQEDAILDGQSIPEVWSLLCRYLGGIFSEEKLALLFNYISVNVIDGYKIFGLKNHGIRQRIEALEESICCNSYSFSEKPEVEDRSILFQEPNSAESEVYFFPAESEFGVSNSFFL